eukprot:COSAG01_NODE_514_length_16043_cov_248.614212_14_plen_94_part_00
MVLFSGHMDVQLPVQVREQAQLAPLLQKQLGESEEERQRGTHMSRGTHTCRHSSVRTPSPLARFLARTLRALLRRSRARRCSVRCLFFIGPAA